MSNFTLDSRLQADTNILGESALNLLLLMNDSRYPWCILVPKQQGLQEIYQLSESDQFSLTKESSLLATVMMDLLPLDKMNIGALGNVVSQLHVHHVGRRKNDPAWPGPVWGHSPAIPYTSEGKQELVNSLAGSSLSSHFTFN